MKSAKEDNHTPARIFLFLFCILFSVTGCIQRTTEAAPTPFIPENTQTPQAKGYQSPTESEEADTSGDPPCFDVGTVERFSIESELLNDTFYFSVFFPPCYSTDHEEGYPVLYLLHGQNFTDSMWLDLGAAQETDRLISEDGIPPFMMVMPYEEFFFRNTNANNFPNALMEELIPEIEDQFNVCKDRACRALGGISRGAAWAMRVGLQEWDTFTSIGAHSLPTFHGDIEDLPDWLEAIPHGEEPRIYIDTGRFDPEVKTAYTFAHVFNQKGIPHEWHLNEGRHNEAYWMENMRDYLRWYAEGWQ